MSASQRRATSYSWRFQSRFLATTQPIRLDSLCIAEAQEITVKKGILKGMSSGALSKVRVDLSWLTLDVAFEGGSRYLSGNNFFRETSQVQEI